MASVNLAVLFGTLSLLAVSAVRAEDAVNLDDSDDPESINRDVRSGFGRMGSGSSFTSNNNDQFMDWKSLFDKLPSKRQLNGYYGGGFDASPDFSNTNLQNWNKYFMRKYRSFMSPNMNSRSGGGSLGFGGHFGTDGLQNWRAFFENRRHSTFRRK